MSFWDHYTQERTPSEERQFFTYALLFALAGGGVCVVYELVKAICDL